MFPSRYFSPRYWARRFFPRPAPLPTGPCDPPVYVRQTGSGVYIQIDAPTADFDTQPVYVLEASPGVYYRVDAPVLEFAVQTVYVRQDAATPVVVATQPVYLRQTADEDETVAFTDPDVYHRQTDEGETRYTREC